MATSIARAVRGASGMVTTFPPLQVIVSVRWPQLPGHGGAGAASGLQLTGEGLDAGAADGEQD